MEYQKLAQEAVRFFRINSREAVELSEDAPQWVFDLVREAHDGMLPDDWRFALILRVLEAMSEGNDPEPDTYFSRLLDWLGSHLNRVGYCDSALEEVSPSYTFSLIQWGQSYEMEDIRQIIEEYFDNLDVAVMAGEEG